MNNISNINNLSDAAILKQIGNFVQQKRIQKDLTQEMLAQQAAISRSTLSLIERGENSALLNLLKILRTLDALYVLEHLHLPEVLSPLQLAKGQTKKRNRASNRSGRSNQNDLEW